MPSNRSLNDYISQSLEFLFLTSNHAILLVFGFCHFIVCFSGSNVDYSTTTSQMLTGLSGVKIWFFKVLVFLCFSKNQKPRKVGFFGFLIVFLDIVVFLYKLRA